ncbi:unnamed protein product [Phaedon cochleariae]|uniref:Major facilitator superfamily (MFS) profile domain-containing protein n=1 Tax=Phaedon cochleariae TaxID=80249 RepID=A0A9N9X1R6_PHACE|nr:unnamed protein product [Phaedon cochleariae]
MVNSARGKFAGTATQFSATITVTLFAISIGLNYSWTAPMIPYLIGEDSHLETTPYEAAWLETEMMIGTFLGLPLTILLIDRIGRKNLILLATCIAMLGWISIAAANKMIYLHAARVILGTTSNMFTVAAPMYVAEIAESRIRGFLSGIFNFMLPLGFILMYCIGPYLPFYIIPIIGISVLTAELLIFSRIPETPYYLLFIDQPELAKKSLQYFRPKQDVQQELKEMTIAIERQKTETGRVQDLILVQSNRRGIIIMTVLNVGLNMVGGSVTVMNLHMILGAASSLYLDSSIVAILFSIVMAISAQAASLTVDKYGRKSLLLISTVCSTCCLLVVTIYFHLKISDYDVAYVSWLPSVAVMVYGATFKFGLGIVPPIINAEIFPAKVKACGMSIGEITFVFGALLSIQIYMWLADICGIHVPFYIFTASGVLLAIFIYFYVPETKGKTLEEIQFLMKKKTYIPVKPQVLLLQDKNPRITNVVSRYEYV